MTRRLLALPLLAVAAMINPATAQEPAAAAFHSSYELPAPTVQELFTRDKNLTTLEALSPDGRRVLVPSFRELSTVARLGQPTQRLAGLELRGQRGRTWRLDTYGIDGLALFDLDSRQTTNIALPRDTLFSDMTWSPDGSRIALLAHGPERTAVWVADAATGIADRLADAAVLATLATRSQGTDPRPSQLLQWTPGSEVIALLVPSGRGGAPERALATGPVVRRTRDDAVANPTYPFLLEDATDAAAFRYHTTSQIALLTPSAAPRLLGEPGMFESVALSPDGAYLLTERIVEPLSPLVTEGSFGRVLEVRDRSGAVVSTIRETPLQEGRESGPGGAAARRATWRGALVAAPSSISSAPATMPPRTRKIRPPTSRAAPRPPTIRSSSSRRPSTRRPLESSLPANTPSAARR